MTHKVPARTAKKIALAYDLGGTKLSAGIVDENGKVLEEIREPAEIQRGKAAVIEQLARLGRDLLSRYPTVRRVGVASAGPLDPIRGRLIDPTNFASASGTWGVTPLASILSRKLKRPVFLENDAAAAMLAEHWIGRARGYDNAIILTLGTGLGTGMVCNGELVRAGHSLHPEGGHITLMAGDLSAPCGCGNLGCAEAYLSGRSFGRRAAQRIGDPALTAKDIAELARSGNRIALDAFSEYARMMAVAIHTYAVLYCPEIVVLTGSFAEASDLFLEAARTEVSRLLVRRRVGIDLLPKITISSLKNQAGLVGGAYVAFHRKEARAAKPKRTQR